MFAESGLFKNSVKRYENDNLYMSHVASSKFLFNKVSQKLGMKKSIDSDVDSKWF